MRGVRRSGDWAGTSALGGLAGLLLLLAGCLGGAGGTRPSPTPSTVAPSATPSLSPTATATPSPTPSPTAVPAPRLELSTSSAPQGGTFLVHLIAPGYTQPHISFLGRDLEPFPVPDGWAALGAVGQPPGVFRLPSAGDYTVAAAATPPGGGERPQLSARLRVTAVAFPVDHITLGPPGLSLLTPGSEAVDQRILSRAYATFTPVAMWHGPLLLPVDVPVTGHFGEKQSFNNGPAVGSHSGTDLGAPEGTPVRAAADGRVVFAGALSVRGNGVVIDHGLGVLTGYFHLSRIDVHDGEQVKRGQVIGAVGETGVADGAHLHWELAVGGLQVDALAWTRSAPTVP